MRSKILSKQTLSIITVIEFIFFSALLLYLIPINSTYGGLMPSVKNTVALPKQKIASLPIVGTKIELPMRLKIPKINVDAVIEYVGLTSDGAMGIPKKTDNLAWFNQGPRPGDNGSAVINGHYGWRNKRLLPFDNLNKLRKGDKLYIKDKNGVVISFVVRESRRYNPEANTKDIFYSDDGKSHLNLITCEGSWDKISKSYSKRLVIFADKID